MDKEEILKKSREENQNKDFVEQDAVKQSSKYALLVMLILATIFFAVQIFVGGGMNWGLYALVFSARMTTFWVKYSKLHRMHELVLAILYTIFVAAFSVCHIDNLITTF